MPDAEHLEIHVAPARNLKCESCSHYSDQGHEGVVSLEDADRWMAPWSGRLRPCTFSLVGGEPTIHPRLTEFVRLARRHRPGGLFPSLKDLGLSAAASGCGFGFEGLTGAAHGPAELKCFQGLADGFQKL
jgi:molybdenum cofactor biosynthesis enzyme MoaA